MRGGKLLAIVAAGSLIPALSGCGVVGPSCLERQQRGPVTSLTGNVAAQQVSSSVVPYDQRGSQNDVNISWAGQGLSGEPRIVMYATAAECTEFVPPAPGERTDDITGPCRIISRCGGSLAPDARPCAQAGTCSPTAEEIICRSLIVTGPGNGAPPGFSQYKLHVVGDATRIVNYSIAITYFFGPDC
jgi:hypothetical protein